MFSTFVGLGRLISCQRPDHTHVCSLMQLQALPSPDRDIPVSEFFL